MTGSHLWQSLTHRIRTRSGQLTFLYEADHSQPADPPKRLLWAIECAGPVAGQRIVDIGCWTGTLLALLVPLHPAELVGVDVPGPWLSVARDTLPVATILAVESLTDIPATFHRKFEIVFFLETLEHLPRSSQLAALRTLAALLAPGGKLVLSTPAAGFAALLDPAWYFVGHRHYRLSTLLALLSSAGLDCSASYYSGNFWASAETLLLYVYKHLLHRRYSPPTHISAWSATGLRRRRRLDSTNVWIEARLCSCVA